MVKKAWREGTALQTLTKYYSGATVSRCHFKLLISNGNFLKFEKNLCGMMLQTTGGLTIAD